MHLSIEADEWQSFKSSARSATTALDHCHGVDGYCLAGEQFEHCEDAINDVYFCGLVSNPATGPAELRPVLEQLREAAGALVSHFSHVINDLAGDEEPTTTLPVEKVISLRHAIHTLLRWDSIEAGEVSPPTTSARLVLDIKRMQIRFDGKVWDSTDARMETLSVLAERPGQWVSPKQFKPTPNSQRRPDKLLRKLPGPVLALIESDRHKGRRLLLSQSEVKVMS